MSSLASIDTSFRRGVQRARLFCNRTLCSRVKGTFKGILIPKLGSSCGASLQATFRWQMQWTNLFCHPPFPCRCRVVHFDAESDGTSRTVTYRFGGLVSHGMRNQTVTNSPIPLISQYYDRFGGLVSHVMRNQTAADTPNTPVPLPPSFSSPLFCSSFFSFFFFTSSCYYLFYFSMGTPTPWPKLISDHGIHIFGSFSRISASKCTGDYIQRGKPTRLLFVGHTVASIQTLSSD